MEQHLRAYLLSEQNVQDLINKLDANILIKEDSLDTCRQIIRTNFSRYLGRLAKQPKTDKQLICSIHFLNQKCYEEIVAFIQSHHQGTNIFKNDGGCSSAKALLQPVDGTRALSLTPGTIITREQYQELIKDRITPDNILQALMNPNVIALLRSIINDHNNKAQAGPTSEIIDIHQLQRLLTNKSVPKHERAVIDLSHLTQESMLAIEARISYLVSLASTNPELITEIESEKADLIAALVNYQKSKDIKIVDGIQDLDLQLQPRSAEDLLNIVFRFNEEKKVKSIKLLDYFIPENTNNITSFTNRFMVYHMGNINQFSVESGKYNIDTLLALIQDRFSFLKLSIDDNNLVSITNNTNAKFDLMIQDYSILPLLGFCDSPGSYKNKITYKASQPFSLDLHESIFISLNRSNTDPIKLQLGEKISLEQPIILRETSKPIALKDISIKLSDKMEQTYDLIGTSFNLHLTIEYA